MSPRHTRHKLDASGTRFADAPLEGPLLVVDGVKTGFVTPAGTAKAVDGVSFSLERGRTLGVVGESGSGKTVLSRSIMGLLPKRNVVREGSVIFENLEISTLRPREMRAYRGAQMAMIFQDPMTSLNPVMKVGRQITESLNYHLDISHSYARELAEALLGSVRIPEPAKRLNEYPHQLSGGMRQRVSIAIALACGPKLLFADEPTTALDVTVQAQVLDLLATQQRERFMSVVLVTHDLGVVAGRCDEIVVMYAGRIVEKATTHTLFTEMRMPYTEALVRSIPNIDDPSHTRLQTIPGRPPSLVNPPPGCTFAPRCRYVQDKCREEEPPLIPGPTPGHEFRCWFPVGTPQGQAALESNEREAALGATAASGTTADPTAVAATDSSPGQGS